LFSSIFNALCICGKIIGYDEDLEKFLEMKNVAGEVVGQHANVDVAPVMAQRK